MDENNNYALPDSPFKDELELSFRNIIKEADKLNDADDTRAVENALYMAVTKRMRGREYSGDPAAYLSGILTDLMEAEREFDEVCYANACAREAFSTISAAISAAS